jgi:2-polyprenyl-6-hydroxyphenyl methylase/3-demethylubiquinone-9 3-methyltransferase
MKTSGESGKPPTASKDALDHSSRKEFYDYYARQSESEQTLTRFLGIRQLGLAAIQKLRLDGVTQSLEVADVGCGAGTQCLMWAELGHRVHGVDINEPLIDLARQRTETAGYQGDYRLGTASALPWADQAMDVCLAPELLEHVPEWEKCLDELARVLAPGGVLVVTTNNSLFPLQDEFNLPLYSWYPAPLKRYFERLAVTTRPGLVNYATYPAVNWFTFFSLAREMRKRGLHPFDRFEVMDVRGMSGFKRLVAGMIGASRVLRFIANALTPYTVIVAVRPEAGVVGRSPSPRRTKAVHAQQ